MIKTLALVLKKQNLGETDRIITVLTPSLGKKRVVARAVRKPLSKLSGHLDTFMVSQIMLTDEPDLPKVTSAQLVESFESVRGSLTKLKQAFAITKITERVSLEDIAQQSVFQSVVDALSRLDQGWGWTKVWLRYLSEVTRQAGLQITHFQCAVCHKAITENAYWVGEERSFYCQSCGSPRSAKSIGKNSIKLLKLLTDKKYQLIAQVKIPEKEASEIEELLLKEITEWFNKPWTWYRALESND